MRSNCEFLYQETEINLKCVLKNDLYLMQVEEKVSRGLVSKLRSSSEFKDIEKKQMILQLLGAKFVEKHLKDEPYVPNVLVSSS